jgi:hypothetical protein
MKSTRRTFLLASLSTAAALSSRKLMAISANQQVNLGFIGCGDRGTQLLEAFKQVNGVRVAGFADPDSERLAKAKHSMPDAQAWSDFRYMLDSTAIDAVVVATCNHWHCLASIWAMQAGKHVYVEKPLSNTQWEGKQVVEAVNKYQRICQVGTQQRSDYLQDDIKQLLHEEKQVGAIKWVRVNRFGMRNQIGRREKPLKIPQSVDYQLWLGPAADEPIFRNELHYDWHWSWNTGAGEMGNWGVHVLDDVRNNVFLDRIPDSLKITAAGGRFVWHDAGSTPNVQFAAIDTGSVPVMIALSNLKPQTNEKVPIMGPSTGYVVHCEGGRLEGQRSKAVTFDGKGKVIKELTGDCGGLRHQDGFIRAIREDNQALLKAPVDVGHQSTTWCNVINVATRQAGKVEPNGNGDLDSTEAANIYQELRQHIGRQFSPGADYRFELGTQLEFDVAKEKFAGKNAKAANQFLRRQDRKAFMIPENV